LIKAMQVLLKASEAFSYQTDKENEECVNIIKDAFALTPEVVKSLIRLWSDVAIIKTFSKKNELNLPEHIQYFFEKLLQLELYKKDYIPTDEDIIKCPDTSLTVEYDISYDKYDIKFIAMGDTQKSASFWTSNFNFNAILYVVSLSEYDYITTEQPRTRGLRSKGGSFKKIGNGLWDALQAFADMMREQNGSNIILFFTGSDVFRKKLFDVDLKVCFPEYTGGASYSEATEFVKQKFVSLNRWGRRLSIQFTSDIDRTEMNFIFDSLKKMTMNESLSKIF